MWLHYLVIFRQSLVSDINVSQGSVATCARCGGILDNHFTANFPDNLSAKKL